MNNSLVQFQTSEFERKLLAEIEEIGYGDIIDVLHKQESDHEPAMLFEWAKAFLVQLRISGSFIRVTIHDGRVSQAETQGVTPLGFRYIKRHKFQN